MTRHVLTSSLLKSHMVESDHLFHDFLKFCPPHYLGETAVKKIFRAANLPHTNLSPKVTIVGWTQIRIKNNWLKTTHHLYISLGMQPCVELCSSLAHLNDWLSATDSILYKTRCVHANTTSVYSK